MISNPTSVKARQQTSLAAILGATGTIGSAIATALAKRGIDLIISGASATRLRDLRNALTRGSLIHVVEEMADLRVPADRARLGAVLGSEVATADALIVVPPHPGTVSFDDINEGAIVDGVTTSLLPLATVVTPVAKAMRSRGHGTIVIITSLYGVDPAPNSVVSGLIRAAVHNYVECAARWLAGCGVVVIAVAPGYIDSPLLYRSAELEAKLRQCSARTVLAEWRSICPGAAFVTPEFLGASVADLCTEDERPKNGSVIRV